MASIRVEGEYTEDDLREVVMKVLENTDAQEGFCNIYAGVLTLILEQQEEGDHLIINFNESFAF